MEERLKALNVTPRFITAVEGESLGECDLLEVYDGAKRKLFFGRDLLPQEIGCLLSHKKVYEEFFASDADFAVVLEDDIILDDDFRQTVNACVEAPVDWDLVRFLSRRKIFDRGYRQIMPIAGTDRELVRIFATPGGAYGYLISRSGATKLLNHMRRIWLPIDALHGRTWETRLNCFAIYPSPLRPDPHEESTIRDDRFVKENELSGLQRFCYPMFRIAIKIYEALGKRWAFYSSWCADKRQRR